MHIQGVVVATPVQGAAEADAEALSRLPTQVALTFLPDRVYCFRVWLSSLNPESLVYMSFCLTVAAMSSSHGCRFNFIHATRRYELS